MSDPLLPYYRRELDGIRRLAGEFAENNPQLAANLRLAEDGVDDPHVARLLEGVAFLAGRVQHRLDDEFPELTEALLEALYPGFLAPFPSCTVAGFVPEPDLRAALRIPVGTEVETRKIHGESCRFRTAAPLTVLPLAIEAARLSGKSAPAPAHPQAGGAGGILTLVLATMSSGLGLRDLGLDRLRLMVRAGTATVPLLELLGQHVLGVALADGPGDPAPTFLAADAVEPGGFGENEALIPWPLRSFSGFRLLSEYFAFPEKYHFVDLRGLARRGDMGERIEIYIYLDRFDPEIAAAVTPQSLALNCVPLVNLFRQRCEPIRLSWAQEEHRVVGDARRERTIEIWSVEAVTESRPDGSTRRWLPFHEQPPLGQPAKGAGRYLVRRREGASRIQGQHVHLALHDPGLDLDAPAESVLSVDALCTNRDLAAELPFGKDFPGLHLAEGQAGIAQLTCLLAPTPTLRPTDRAKHYWRLISHLALSHHAIIDGPAGAASLAAVLRLYDRRDTAETQAAIAGLVGVSSAPGGARLATFDTLGRRHPAFCRGLDVTLEFAAASWVGSGLFLLAAVLERFLSMHATVNAFVRTRAVLSGRRETIASFPPRAGGRPLL